MLTIEHSGKLEEWELIVEQGDILDAGTFEVSFLDPNTGDTWFSGPISVNGGSDHMRKKLKPFFNQMKHQ